MTSTAAEAAGGGSGKVHRGGSPGPDQPRNLPAPILTPSSQGELRDATERGHKCVLGALHMQHLHLVVCASLNAFADCFLATDRLLRPFDHWSGRNLCWTRRLVGPVGPACKTSALGRWGMCHQRDAHAAETCHNTLVDSYIM